MFFLSAALIVVWTAGSCAVCARSKTINASPLLTVTALGVFVGGVFALGGLSTL